MSNYKFRKRDLMKCLEQVGDDNLIMINLGGHAAPSYPITHIEDSTSAGFWELRCDPTVDFWDALKIANKNSKITEN